MLPILPLLALLAPIAQNPREHVQLDVNALSEDVSILSLGDYSICMWKDSSTEQIFCSTGDGRGLDWSTPIQIDDNLGFPKELNDKCLTYSEGIWHVVWRDARNGDYDVFHSSSSDNGQTWSPPFRIDDGYAAGAQSVDDLQIVSDSNYVYIVMRVDNPTGGEGCWMASSMDFGNTWNPSLQADSAGADVDYQAICCEGINAFVVFCDNRDPSGDDDLFMRMTHNGGTSWMMGMAEEQIDQSGPGVGDVEYPEILLAGGMQGLVVAWLEDETPTSPSDEELHFLYSPDGGHLWPNPEVVIGSGFDVENPSLAFDGNTVILAWEDDRNGSDQIYTTQSNDFGLSWSPEQQISSVGGSYPVVKGQGSTWGIVFGASFPETTALAVSRNGGISFENEIDLENGAGNDTDYNELSYNKHYGNFVSAWLDDASGSNNVFVGGARPQTISAISPSFMPGDSIYFEASLFPSDEDGKQFAVMLSGDTGSYLLPFSDGRNTGLLNNPFLPSRLSLFSGSLSLGGGITPTLTIPNTPGAIWYACGISFEPQGGGVTSLHSVTDLIKITVQ